MARALWKGVIEFGAVAVPVKLYTAVRPQGIQFHMLHDQDHVRLQRKMVCPKDGKEVRNEHVVKGYEVSPGQYVIVKESELEAAAPRKSKTIEIGFPCPDFRLPSPRPTSRIGRFSCVWRLLSAMPLP